MVAAVAYHVEVRRSFRRARAFNLSAEKLRRSVVAPWVAGRPLELGDRRWEPRESELRILEGPELSPPELAFGQGWNSAERSGHNVTRRVLADVARPPATRVAIVAEAAATGAVVAEALAAVGAEPAELVGAGEWRIGGTGGYAAAVIAAAGPDPSPGWLFEAGLAIGAFGSRAIVLVLGAAATPTELRGFDAVRLDPADPATLTLLAERLRLAVGDS